jgi:hypothetical protein
MTTTKLLAIGLGAGLLLGSGAAVAQSQDDDRQSSPTDAVTKPLGDAAGQSGSDRSTQSGQSSSPLGASGGNPAQQNLSFGVLDVNTDGKLSQEEVSGNATLKSDFSKLDTDRNGSLSNGEFAAFESKGSANGTQGGAKSGSSGTKGGAKSKDTNRSAPGEQASDEAKRAGDKAEDKMD